MTDTLRSSVEREARAIADKIDAWMGEPDEKESRDKQRAILLLDEARDLLRALFRKPPQPAPNAGLLTSSLEDSKARTRLWAAVMAIPDDARRDAAKEAWTDLIELLEQTHPQEPEWPETRPEPRHAEGGE